MVEWHEFESGTFAWDLRKEAINVLRHGITFAEASRAFLDPHRLILEDAVHSIEEHRYFCVGGIMGRIMTVRFTYREGRARIIGAGYWRKWRKLYEKTNALR
jgi:uncharacterized DUF497 family protein